MVEPFCSYRVDLFGLSAWAPILDADVFVPAAPVELSGTASLPLAIGAAGTGTIEVRGAATPALAIGAVAVAQVEVHGAAAPAVGLGVTTTGAVEVHGAGGAAVALEAAGAGQVAVRAAASVGVGLGASAAGAVDVRGAAALVLGLGLVAAGELTALPVRVCSARARHAARYPMTTQVSQNTVRTITRLEAVFYDAGAPWDPATVRLMVRAPTGELRRGVPRYAETLHVYGEPGGVIVRDSTGTYHADVLLTNPGRWRWRWESTADGEQTAKVGAISVAPA